MNVRYKIQFPQFLLVPRALKASSALSVTTVRRYRSLLSLHKHFSTQTTRLFKQEVVAYNLNNLITIWSVGLLYIHHKKRGPFHLLAIKRKGHKQKGN
jgi:hypothetical protein